MSLALSEARKCVPTPTAFCVGCVLVTRWPDDASPPFILSSGYSRELLGNTHAEANALSKANGLTCEDISRFLAPDITGEPPSMTNLLHKTDVYTTLEPCSVRTSGLSPCAEALILAGVRRCVIGVGEPDDFVQCEGARKLADAGIQVEWLKGMEDECLAVARGRDASQKY